VTTHHDGKDEMNAAKNHGTSWVMQVTAYSQWIGNKSKMEFCRKRFKEVLIPHQMGENGSFPLGLKRTRPYNDFLFN